MAKRGNNEGSIFRLPDGRWRATLSVGYRNGKRWRKVYEATLRADVQERLDKAREDQKDGLPIVTARQTVGQFLSSWLSDVVKPSVKPKTYRTYADLVKIHILPALGRHSLAKLSPQHIRAFLNDKLTVPQASRRKPEHGKPAMPGKPLSARTVKHLLVTLRGALETAVKDGLVPRNVAALVDPPRVRKVQFKTFSPEQARSFLEAIKGHRFEALFATAIALGYRQGEALGLQWPDVDLDAGTLTVRQAIQRVDGKLTIVPTKGDKVHSVNLPAVTKSALIVHRAKQEDERRLAGSRWHETGFVFTTGIGTPLDARGVIRVFHSILTVAELPKIRFHDLRHSVATLLLAQGVSPRYISDLLGHSQVSFTMQTYAHVLPHVQRDVASKMDEILNPVATEVATDAAPKPARIRVSN
jgi:integrase